MAEETIKIQVGEVSVELDKEEASKAIEAGEIKLPADDLVIYKKDEFDSFQESITKEKDDEYKKGKKAGQEMTVKEAREKFGLEFEGKTLDNAFEAYKKKVMEEAKVEPNQKIEELQNDNKKLQDNYAELENQFNEFKGQVQEKETRSKKDSTSLKFIPDEGLKVDKDLTLMALKNKAGFDIDFDEQGNVIPMLNGQVVKNQKTLKPEDPQNVIMEHLKALNLLQTETPGRGKKDETGNGQTKNGYDAFVKEMEENEIYAGSEKFNQEMNKRIENKTLEF